MTRLQALEAVAEAALGVSRLWGRGLSDIGGLRRALAALDALPADPDPDPARGEVVVELWMHKDGDICALLPGSFIARDWEANRFRRRLGITRLSLVKGDGA